MRVPAWLLLFCSLLASCALRPPVPSEAHLHQMQAQPGQVATTEPVQPTPPQAEPHPLPAALTETYSVVVQNLPIEQLLFALARDARLDIDIRHGLQGRVSIKALNQTLPQILERLSGQLPLRYSIRGSLLVVGPDTPYLKEYVLDYVSVTRKTRSKVSISASIGAAGGGIGGTAAGLPNASSSEIENISDHHPWTTLERNIRDLLESDGELEPSFPAGPPAAYPQADEDDARRPASSRTAAEPGTSAPAVEPAGIPVMAAGPTARASPPSSVAASLKADRAPAVIINAEAGLIAVRATERQHRRVQAFLDGVQAGITRQVLIEATLVEVLLDRSHQSGVDWSRVGQGLDRQTTVAQTLIGNNFGSGPLALFSYQGNSDLLGGTFSATLKLLETFGRTRVLSSPKVVALNNQMAVLKVVDEKVYFEIKATRTEASEGNPGRVDYSSHVKSVPIGVMMSVIPQISARGQVSLNVRPTITRITGYKVDPTTSLLGSTVNNLVPEIQVREIESTLKLLSGQTAVLGGLMQEGLAEVRQGIPLLMHLPWIGHLFRYSNDSTQKTELVIFLRPTVIEHPSLHGDLASWQSRLPDARFFEGTDHRQGATSGIGEQP